MMEQPLYDSQRSMVNFYRDQLKSFHKIGIGNFTRFDVQVTDKLINVTKKRLAQLSILYDRGLTPAAERWRKRKEKALNELNIKDIRKQSNIL